MLVQNNQFSHGPAQHCQSFLPKDLFILLPPLNFIRRALFPVFAVNLLCLLPGPPEAPSIKNVQKFKTHGRYHKCSESFEGHWLVEGVQESVTVGESQVLVSIARNQLIEAFGSDFGGVFLRANQVVESFLQHKFLVVSDGNLCVFKSLIQRHLPYQVPLKSHNFLTFIWQLLLKRLGIEVSLFCNFGFSEVYGFFHGFLGLVLDSAQGPRTWSYRCVLTIN